MNYFDKSKGDNMSNTFMNQLINDTNYKYTENGALAHRSTNSAICDLFAFGGAYRGRSEDDCIFLFKKAFEENETLALKCLFYLRDCRGGQGERRFFRICLKWLAENYPARIRHLIKYIPEYGRYDDMFELFDTSLENDVMELIRTQLIIDMSCKENGISLLAKWLPSENASSSRTIATAKKIRNALQVSSKQYRKMLSGLRKKINVLEKLMSANEWDKIEFDKIPSKAGLKYKNAFARRDIIAKKYEAFAKSKKTTVNAKTLYPYEIVEKAIRCHSGNDVDRAIINKYWENLPDYLEGKDCSIMCVVDTSGSMWGTPINVAISLGLYCAERIGGDFSNYYISFSSKPNLIKTEGVDFVDKVKRIYRTNLCDNTNLSAVFDLLLNTAITKNVDKEDIPETLIVLSDMEIDMGAYDYHQRKNKWSTESAATEMEKIRKKWQKYGLKLPRLIYWNLDARSETILDSGPNVSFVSGFSPVLFKQILTGKNGLQLCLEAITADRYEVIE